MASLHIVAVLSLAIAILCAAVIGTDMLMGHPQPMAIMNAVWPITALYLGPVGLWAYWAMGRPMARGEQHAQEEMQHHGNMHMPAMPMQRGTTPQTGPTKPYWQTIFVATSHCGGGCTLGDIIAEFSIFFLGVTIAGIALWPEFIGDFALAFLLGVVFQYFSIVPMRHLAPGEGIIAALKADALSLTAFEVGLFGWMALMRFVFFHPPLHPDEASYWFMMQIGMAIGFLTSYPMNWWLVRVGIKEGM